MSKKRILFVTQEMDPYTLDTEVSNLVRNLPISLGEAGYDLRVLMPCFGVINERRHKLHEVVRLSGMNIIVDDDDYPLIIKVASIPNSRMQVYFLDNFELFKRKFIFKNEEGEFFDDNLERLFFFNKSAIEIVRKFGWAPDIVYLHGWMTSLIPMYLKTTYKTDPIFKQSKIVYAAYNHEKDTFLAENFHQKATTNQMVEADIKHFYTDKQLNLHQGASKYSDCVIVTSDEMDEATLTGIKSKCKNIQYVQGEDTLLQLTLNIFTKILK